MKAHTTPTVSNSPHWPHSRSACSLCGADLKNYTSDRTDEGFEKALATHAERVHFAPEVGEFVQFRMVTDTAVYEIVKVSPSGKSMTVRSCIDGDTLDTDGGAYPIIEVEQRSNPNGREYTLRLRKNGTWKMNDYSTLTPANRIDGKPVRHINYTM